MAMVRGWHMPPPRETGTNRTLTARLQGPWSNFADKA